MATTKEPVGSKGTKLAQDLKRRMNSLPNNDAAILRAAAWAIANDVIPSSRNRDDFIAELGVEWIDAPMGGTTLRYRPR